MLFPITSVRCPACVGTFRVHYPARGGGTHCPNCRTHLVLPAIEPPQPRQSGGITLGQLVAGAIVGVVALKTVQALFDEDFGDGEFPAWFRAELRDEHIAWNGHTCPDCGRRVRYRDLTVDHIVALRNGGRTSRANAAILCRRCNSRKNDRNSIFDYLAGRSA